MAEPVKPSPRWAYAVCLILIAAAFLSFVVFLGRLPLFEGDEAFFNVSAVRYLSGSSFAYTVFTQAPHRELVLAHHGPFFLNLQILTLKVLGIHHFACRFPGYLGAHLAVLVLCLFLLGEGMHIAAIVCAVSWLGDRSLMAISLGRPDGLAQLGVVGGFVCLVRGCREWQAGQCMSRRAFVLFFLTGLCLGTAIGFHPGTLYLGIATGLAALLLLPVAAWPRVCGAVAAGGVIPFGLLLLCWSPYLKECVEQFRWVSQYNLGAKSWSVLANLQGSLRLWPVNGWAQYWHVGVMLATLALAPVSAALGLVRRRRMDFSTAEVVGIAASFLAAGALWLLLQSVKCPYYFLYLTMWPVVALAAYWEAARARARFRTCGRIAGRRGRRPSSSAHRPFSEFPGGRSASTAACSRFCSQLLRGALLAPMLILGLVWLPSLAWNALRFREGVLWYRILDRLEMVEDLRATIPSGVKVTGNPTYFIIAHQAGLDFTPLAWEFCDPGLAASAQPDAWLVLSPGQRDFILMQDARFFDRRPLIAERLTFRGSPYTEYTYLIYGPVKGDDRPQPK
jgi:hypothetical protein